MSEDDCRRGVEFPERFVDQVGLRLRRPDSTARSPAVTVPRPVEDDDAIFLAALSRSPLKLEVLNHAAIAVQQDERLALARST